MPKKYEITQRLALTGIWMMGLAVSVVGVESYMSPGVDGVSLLVPQDRVAVLKPLLFLYSSYLAGILGFWYTAPFTMQNSKSVLHRIRFALAFWSTLVVNAVVVYLVWRNHLGATDTVQESVSSAITLAASLSPIVAPANAYYFGLSGATTASGSATNAK